MSTLLCELIITVCDMKVRVTVVDIQFSVCVCGCGSILLEKKMLDLLVICFSCCCALRAVGVLADVTFFWVG